MEWCKHTYFKHSHKGGMDPGSEGLHGSDDLTGDAPRSRQVYTIEGESWHSFHVKESDNKYPWKYIISMIHKAVRNLWGDVLCIVFEVISQHILDGNIIQWVMTNLVNRTTLVFFEEGVLLYYISQDEEKAIKVLVKLKTLQQQKKNLVKDQSRENREAFVKTLKKVFEYALMGGRARIFSEVRALDRILANYRNFTVIERSNIDELLPKDIQYQKISWLRDYLRTPSIVKKSDLKKVYMEKTRLETSLYELAECHDEKASGGQLYAMIIFYITMDAANTVKISIDSTVQEKIDAHGGNSVVEFRECLRGTSSPITIGSLLKKYPHILDKHTGHGTVAGFKSGDSSKVEFSFVKSYFVYSGDNRYKISAPNLRKLYGMEVTFGSTEKKRPSPTVIIKTSKKPKATSGVSDTAVSGRIVADGKDKLLNFKIPCLIRSAEPTIFFKICGLSEIMNAQLWTEVAGTFDVPFKPWDVELDISLTRYFPDGKIHIQPPENDRHREMANTALVKMLHTTGMKINVLKQEKIQGKVKISDNMRTFDPESLLKNLYLCYIMLTKCDINSQNFWVDKHDNGRVYTGDFGFTYKDAKERKKGREEKGFWCMQGNFGWEGVFRTWIYLERLQTEDAENFAQWVRSTDVLKIVNYKTKVKDIVREAAREKDSSKWSPENYSEVSTEWARNVHERYRGMTTGNIIKEFQKLACMFKEQKLKLFEKHRKTLLDKTEDEAIKFLSTQ
jgi:hypothetical protein